MAVDGASASSSSSSAASTGRWRRSFGCWLGFYVFSGWNFGFFFLFFLFVIFVERVAEASGVAKLVGFIVTHVEGLLEEIHLSSSVFRGRSAGVRSSRGKIKKTKLATADYNQRRIASQPLSDA
jgi:hypothetical protein